MKKEFKCGICGSNRASLIYHFDSADIVLCQDCETAQTVKLASEKAIYEEDYFRGRDLGLRVDYLEARDIFLADDRKRLKEIKKKYPSGGKILEIGAATGYFLEVCREEGWNAYGVEVSEFAAKKAKEKGLNVFYGELKDAGFAKESFDVIVGWHVLEHLNDPLGTLAIARDLLKPEGLLVLAVPDFGSPRAKKMKENWPPLEPKFHLYHFTHKTLKNILKKAGFKVIDYSLGGGTGITGVERSETTKQLARFIVRHLKYFQWLRSIINFVLVNVLRRHDFITIYAVRE